MRNDLTVAHHRELYLVPDAVTTKKVVVEEGIDGTREILSEVRPVQFREIWFSQASLCVIQDESLRLLPRDPAQAMLFTSSA